MADAPNQPPILRFVRRTANASTPKRQTPGSVGFDLFRYFLCFLKRFLVCICVLFIAILCQMNIYIYTYHDFVFVTNECKSCYDKSFLI